MTSPITQSFVLLPKGHGYAIDAPIIKSEEHFTKLHLNSDFKHCFKMFFFKNIHGTKGVLAVNKVKVKRGSPCI